MYILFCSLLYTMSLFIKKNDPFVHSLVYDLQISYLFVLMILTPVIHPIMKYKKYSTQRYSGILHSEFIMCYFKM